MTHKNENPYRNLWFWRYSALILACYLYISYSCWQPTPYELSPAELATHYSPIPVKSKHPLAQPGGRAQQRPQIKTDKIKAYVISMNASQPRFVHTARLLKACGLEVIHVTPINWKDPYLLKEADVENYPDRKGKLEKTFSNKWTMKMIWDWITTDPDLDHLPVPFSLIFEDDPEISRFFTPSMVPSIAMTAAAIQRRVGYSGLFYLGMGQAWDVPTCDETGKYIENFNGISFNQCTPRLFHATGLLKYEGKWLFERVLKLFPFGKDYGSYPYMDAMVQDALRMAGPARYPTVAAWNKFDVRASALDMRGIFFQDRNRFRSEIQDAP